MDDAYYYTFCRSRLSSLLVNSAGVIFPCDFQIKSNLVSSVVSSISTSNVQFFFTFE